MRISLFKINKNKQFNYKPVFYDPAKEEMMTSVKEAPEGSDAALQSLKSSIKNQWHKPKKSSAVKYSNTTLALIIALLVAVIYLLLK